MSQLKLLPRLRNQILLFSKEICEGQTHKRTFKKYVQVRDNVLKYKNKVQKLKLPKNEIDLQKNEKLRDIMILDLQQRKVVKKQSIP